MKKSSFKMSTANSVWIATAMLHSENKVKDAFQSQEIFQKVKDLGLQQTADVTVKAHISTHCVANTKAWPNTHRKLLRISNGWYRLFRLGYPYHSSRENGITCPLAEEILPEYDWLIDWYNKEFCKAGKSVPQSRTSSSNLPFTKIETDGSVKLPNVILKKMNLQDGDYLAFVEEVKGEILIKKAKVQLEIS